jgi:hypothetical protein
VVASFRLGPTSRLLDLAAALLAANPSGAFEERLETEAPIAPKIRL